MINKQLVIAGIVGLIAGCVVFFAIQPLLIGQFGSPFLEHGSQIGLILSIFPFVVFPLVCVAGFCFRPTSRAQAFKISMVFATALLIPIPLVGYWIVWPKRVGFGPFSAETLGSVAYGFVELIILALIASYIASILVVLLARLFSRGIKSVKSA